eukprot:TRINITY_DN190_c0_g1_i1.p1 TRINITY_DN190_c0_g1~~TRINITY_DN190_c0_g1_i1.p1  ORF type:complete len:85 (+),score=7.45 TRINITY_DN190_c0_g1_i1:77-331(+)
MDNGINAGNNDYEYLVKLLMLGDQSVGKSNLLIKFIDGENYKKSSLSTIGIDFRHKVQAIDNNRVKIQIWDTAGQERFRTITRS